MIDKGLLNTYNAEWRLAGAQYYFYSCASLRKQHLKLSKRFIIQDEFNEFQEISNWGQDDRFIDDNNKFLSSVFPFKHR